MDAPANRLPDKRAWTEERLGTAQPGRRGALSAFLPCEAQLAAADRLLPHECSAAFDPQGPFDVVDALQRADIGRFALGCNPLLGIGLLFIREHFCEPRHQKREHSCRAGDPVNVRYNSNSFPCPQVRESKFGVIPHRSGCEALEIFGE